MIKKFIFNQKVAPYVFVSPFIIIFCVFSIYPITNTIIMSFQKILPGQTKFVGIYNYKRLLHDPVFLRAIINSSIYMVITCAILVPIPAALAALISSKNMYGSNFFKAIMYLPALASIVVAGTIFRLMFSEMDQSLMNLVVGAFGIQPVKWLRQPVTGFTVLVLLCCWRWTGVNMMYFLAGLKNIPEELYESSDIDGATTIQKFRFITLPMLKPTSIYVLTISIYGGLAMFTESFMLWTGNNSPGNMALTIVGYLYRQGIERNDLGYGSTVGIVLLVLAMVFNVIQLKFNGVFKKGESI